MRRLEREREDKDGAASLRERRHDQTEMRLKLTDPLATSAGDQRPSRRQRRRTSRMIVGWRTSRTLGEGAASSTCLKSLDGRGRVS